MAADPCQVGMVTLCWPRPVTHAFSAPASSGGETPPCPRPMLTRHDEALERGKHALECGSNLQLLRGGPWLLVTSDRSGQSYEAVTP